MKGTSKCGHLHYDSSTIILEHGGVADEQIGVFIFCPICGVKIEIEPPTYCPTCGN